MRIIKHKLLESTILLKKIKKNLLFVNNATKNKRLTRPIFYDKIDRRLRRDAMTNEELKQTMSDNAKATQATDPNAIAAATAEPDKNVHTAMVDARKDYDKKVAALTGKSNELSDEELAKASKLDLETYSARRDTIIDKLQAPVQNPFNHDDETFKFEDTTTGRIGNWSADTMQQYHQRVASTDEKNPNQEYWQYKLDENANLHKHDYLNASQERDITPDISKIHIKKINTELDDIDINEDLLQSPNTSTILIGPKQTDECKDQNVIASYNLDSLTIQMATDEEQKRAEATQTPDNFENRFIQGDPLTQLEVINHENVHRDHFINDGMGKLRSTPVNTAKCDRLTETTAEAATWLQYAYKYSEFKQLGLETIEINGEQKPLDYILEGKPGLKEAVEGLNGDFDINNPEHRRAIVKASSEYWHTERIDQYNSQAHGSASICPDIFAQLSYGQQLASLQNEEQNYARISERMLKDVPIQLGSIRVDLTDCRDLLDTMSTQEAQQLTADISHVTLEEMQEIDAHLQSKGCTTETEKMEYMKNFLANTYLRTGESQDPELLKIMLSHNSQITYADGLAITQKDGLTEVNGLKIDTSLLTTQTKPEETLAKEAPTEEKTNTTLPPALAMAMQQRGR